MSKIFGGSLTTTTHSTSTTTYEWTPSDSVTDYGSKTDSGINDPEPPQGVVL